MTYSEIRLCFSEVALSSVAEARVFGRDFADLRR